MITPYYDDGNGIQIYCGDCREILPQLDVKVDLVLTDPPYGLDIMHAGGRSRMNGWRWREYKDECEWDLSRPDKSTFDLIIAAAPVSIVWGGNYFTDYLPPSKQWLVWDKGQRDFSLADGEMAWSSQDKAMRIFTYPRSAMLQENGLHPTQKPIKLMTWCISQVEKADLILDPFLGSGTTLVAAKILGRKAIGIEIEEKYCKIAVERLRQSVMRLDEPPQESKMEKPLF